MDYTVLEVSAGCIQVQYSDGTKQLVYIPNGSTLEDIDDCVSWHDPDFTSPQGEVPNIDVGVTRTSVRKDIVIQGNYSTTFPRYVDISAIATYYSQRGDDRIKDALDARIESFVSDVDFSIDTILNDIEFHSVDIVAQAEEELNQNG
jgi:hypothetical protein